MSISLGKPYVPHSLYGDSSSRVMHDDPQHQSWAPKGNPHTDIGTSHALIGSSYVSGYVGYFFGGTSGGFLDDQ